MQTDGCWDVFTQSRAAKRTKALRRACTLLRWLHVDKLLRAAGCLTAPNQAGQDACLTDLAAQLATATRTLEATEVTDDTLRVRTDRPASTLMDRIFEVNRLRRTIESNLLVAAYGNARAIGRRICKAPEAS